MDIDQLRAIISPLNVRELLKIRTALSFPPTEAAQNIARKIVRRIVNYDFSGRTFDRAQVSLMSLLAYAAQEVYYSSGGWHLLISLLSVPVAFIVSDELDKVKEKWRLSSWREWLWDSTAKRNGAEAVENAGLDLMLLSDKRGTALAAAHIHEVSKAIDVLLQTRIQDVDEFNKKKEKRENCVQPKP